MANLQGKGAVGRLLVTIAAMAFVATPQVRAQQTEGPLVRTLTLNDVFRQVEGANPGLKAGAAGVDAARATTRQSLAELLPQIRGEAQQLRQHSTLAGTQFGGLEGDPGAGSFLSMPEHFDTFSAGVTLTVPVVDARNIATWKASQLEQQATELQQVTNVQDTLAMAAELYFTHLRNLSRLDVIRKNIERDQLLLDIAQQRREAGVATELDVTRGQVALARDRQEMLAQQTAVTQTRMALLRVMSLPPSTRLELTPVAPEAPHPARLPDAQNVVETRPEHQAAKALLRRNEVAEKAAAWQRFPNISLIGQYGLQSEVAFDGGQEDVWYFGVSLNVPIWEGGRIKSEKQQARALIRQQEYVIESLEDEIGADYIVAIETVQKRWEELPFAQESVLLSEQELRYARERFEAGVADNSDVVTAQAGVAAATDAEVDTIFRYHMARLQLARVLGHVAEELGR